MEMMPRSISLILCAILGLGWIVEAGTDPTSRTLQQVIWDIGAVNEDQAQIERELGEDPLALIELPDSSGWFKGMSGPEIREVNLNIADWYVMDSSGLRGGAFFSVWCDNGNLYLDLIQARGLRNAEGTATVDWAFDGEPFKQGQWDQKEKFIVPRDDFLHDYFVRRLASARFLVLQIKGQAGLEDPMAVTVKRPENVALVPVSLSGERADLVDLIQHARGRRIPASSRGSALWQEVLALPLVASCAGAL